MDVIKILLDIRGPVNEIGFDPPSADFGSIWSDLRFHKFGWVFHKFTENGELYIVWILTVRRKNRDAWFVTLRVLKEFGKI